ncbi:MAG: 23S rRNA (guanosine(2251)-2'-O)-methyltransferase RlmB [Flavobacteriaceae bacterium]
MGKSQIVYGKNSVIEAVKAKKSISKVFINSGINKKNLIELLKTLDDNRTPYSYVPAQKLNKLTPHNHQGIVAMLSEIIFSSLEELVETYQSPGIFVLLDGITDTRNMGAIIRSAAAANATAVVIPTSGSAQITGETMKTSAGGVFQVPICRVNHLKDALYLLQSYDILSIVADEKAEQNLFEFDLTNTVTIVMGDENKGVSQGVRKLCSYTAKLPILGEMDSYNVSVAAGMFFYETIRQRLKS